MSTRIALAGNPNSGKTSLFNVLTGSKQHVGNWPGVTVEKKEGIYTKNKDVTVLDLPGTYSLSPYTSEEIIAREYIVNEKPDVIINIVDGTLIERNLYLTLQIAETKVPMVVAVNMMDEVEANGDIIDFKRLSEIFGVPFIPIVARQSKGIDELLDAALEIAKEEKKPLDLPVFDEYLKKAINEIQISLKMQGDIGAWNAIKILEGDDAVINSVSTEKLALIDGVIKEAVESSDGDIEIKIADLRYKFIDKVVKESIQKGKKDHTDHKSYKIDKILTNRILALPIFAVVMYLLFALTFSENFLFVKGLPSPGIFLSNLLVKGWENLSVIIDSGLTSLGASDWVMSLVVDGIMSGLGAVVGFLPLILVLFLLLSFLEDCGYISRIAFVMDRVFQHFGLSGKSIIPLLMGFGCSVPAIMSARTLENDKDRKITIMITPFMSCSAKLPVYIMFAGTLFAGSNKTLIIFSLYVLGLVVAFLSAFILSKLIKGESSNFIMELPKYRLPTLKSTIIHAWEKIKDFLIKAGTIIFASTIIIWLLSNFNFSGMTDAENSLLASIGNSIKFIFAPLGFGEWRATVGVIAGWAGKENIVATFGQLFAGVTDSQTIDAIMAGEQSLPAISDVFNKVSAFSYMAFNLLCMPCFAAVGAISREMNSPRWTIISVAFHMMVAYIVAFLINTIGNLIF